jgi:predicted DNA-binding transcriptional regulator AlpA
MIKLSTRQAAKKLGISHETLSHYVAAGKVPAPEIVTVGHRVVHMWTDAEIEHVRQLLPKVANGRKTRYTKKHSAVSTHGTPGHAQQSVKAKGKTKTKKKK